MNVSYKQEMGNDQRAMKRNIRRWRKNIVISKGLKMKKLTKILKFEKVISYTECDIYDCVTTFQ